MSFCGQGIQMEVFDNLSHGHREAVPREAELVVGELADGAALDQIMRAGKFDAVMHFAALIEAGEPKTKVPE